MKSRIEVIESEIKSNSRFNDIRKVLDIKLFTSLIHKWAAILIFLIIWEVAPLFGWINPLYIPPPTTIAVEMWNLTITGVLPIATLSTFARVFAGIGIAIIVALPLGYLLGGYFKNFEKVSNPVVKLLEQGNPLSLFHLFVLLVGLTELSTIIVVYWAAQFPMLNNTTTAMKNVDPVLIKVGKVSGLNKFDLFWKILLPASLPTVFTGIRLGVVFAFLILMGVEMMGMSSGVGLGYLIMTAQMATMIPRMWAGIVTMSLLCIAINYALLRLEKHFTKWKQDNSEI